MQPLNTKNLTLAYKERLLNDLSEVINDLCSIDTFSEATIKAVKADIAKLESEVKEGKA